MKATQIMAVLALSLLGSMGAYGQQLMGVVIQKGVDGTDEPVPGAHVRWLGTDVATTTRENGVFLIDRTLQSDQLVVSFTGLVPDTLQVTADQENLWIELRGEMLDEVTVEGWRPASGIDHARTVNTLVMQEEELFKAACCNLSESFETNPAVDVSFTDALTGTRQIEMLGLSGPNTLVTVEQMPAAQGWAASQGIQFIPGSWINAIEITKGTGSVVNGYEGIAGHINVALKRPEESDKVFVNGYVGQAGRVEANGNFTFMAGDRWATTLLLHASARPFEMDENDDGFRDFPVGQQFNAINRWVYNSGTGWLAQFGVQAVYDNKVGGQMGFDPERDRNTTNRYGLGIASRRLAWWGKAGYQFPGAPYKSISLQTSLAWHDHESYFGLVRHDGNEGSFYGNLIYQSIIGSTNHSFKTGLSLMHLRHDEILVTDRPPYTLENNEAHARRRFDRDELAPGAFFEYTFNHLDKVTVVAGLRVDHHNLFGTFFTPRLHTKWGVTPSSTLRLSAGKGTRVAQLLSEHPGVLASSRQLVFSNQSTRHAYGFEPDEAWNFGASFSQDFNLDYRPGTVSVDYYFTDFVRQVVFDMEQSGRAMFYPLAGASYAHSFQTQVDYELMRRLDLRLAYRLNDVRTQYQDGLRRRPLTPRHRAFANVAYETRNHWKFDFTLQWTGRQRIPGTLTGLSFYRDGHDAPEFVTMNAQVTRDFGQRWSVYLGAENISNYRLYDPIIAAQEPFGPFFDASLVWGPVFGRMLYAGFRFRM